MDIKEAKKFFEKLPNKVLFKCLTDKFVEDYDNAFAIVIKALVKQEPKEIDTETINRGIDISGEYDIDYNMLCPNCKAVVGDYEANELYYVYCPTCGQKLKYTYKEE